MSGEARAGRRDRASPPRAAKMGLIAFLLTNRILEGRLHFCHGYRPRTNDLADAKSGAKSSETKGGKMGDEKAGAKKAGQMGDKKASDSKAAGSTEEKKAAK